MTLNAIVDYTARLDVFHSGELNRLDRFRRDPSGKGLNVSLALSRLDTASAAVCFLGGEEGRFIHAELSKRGVDTRVVWTSEPTRVGIKVFEEQTGGLTELNERGPRVSPAELDEMRALLSGLIERGDMLVLSGSTPPGVTPAIYAELVELAHKKGATAVLDADGEALRAGVSAGPDLIKPNAFEAGQLLNRTIDGEEAARQAARDLTTDIPAVVLTLGAQGAVLATRDGLVRVYAPRVKALSSAGCGDAFLSGVLAARSKGEQWVTAARFGAAVAAGAAELEGTNFPTLERVRELLAETHAEPVD